MSHGIAGAEHHSNNAHTQNVFLERGFWLRVWGYVKEDLFFLYKAINIIFAILFGIVLFLLDFPLVKEFLTFIVAIPLSIFLAVKYLTLVPTIFFIVFLAIQPKYAAVSLSIVSLFSFIWVLLV